MRFSIITPSFRNSNWLKLCIASVADQQMELEHIVQDSCSDDGTLDWLPGEARVTAVIEKDRGMYDAVNRGFRRAKGELLAYINCDEQYLEGALGKVSRYFDAHPEVDIVFGDCVVVDAKGEYLCDRTALVPQRLHTLVSGNLSFFTAATFLRRRVITDHNLVFESSLRDIGDAEWTLRALESGVRFGLLRELVAAFTETGANMNLGANAAREKKEFVQRAPAWARRLAPLIVGHYRFRRLLAGSYWPKPHQYAIYTAESPDQRRTFPVPNPTYRWRR